jgi:hypothetical protein
VTHLHYFSPTYISHFCPQNQPILSVNCGKPDILPKYWYIFYKNRQYCTCRTVFKIYRQHPSWTTQLLQLLVLNLIFCAFVKENLPSPHAFSIYEKNIKEYILLQLHKHRGSVFSLYGFGFRIRSQEVLYVSDNFMFCAQFCLEKSSVICRYCSYCTVFKYPPFLHYKECVQVVQPLVLWFPCWCTIQIDNSKQDILTVTYTVFVLLMSHPSHFLHFNKIPINFLQKSPVKAQKTDGPLHSPFGI